jgi:RNA polymerase sigma-70 factor (ECF subfamily)
VFDAEYVAAIGPSLARFQGGDHFTREVQQELRCRLLAPPEPRIATYAGTGPLLAWVRIAAMRLALNSRRRVLRRSEELIVDEFLKETRVEDVERPRYVETLSRAVQRAFAELTVQERNLLRLHYADGLSLQQLAKLEQVHRATVARWLAAARQRIFQLVEDDVRGSLGLSPSEFKSVLGLVHSYLEASLSGLFRVPATP